MKKWEFVDFINNKFVVGMACQCGLKCRASNDFNHTYSRNAAVLGRSNYMYELVNADDKILRGYIFYNKKKFCPGKEWKGLDLEEQLLLAFLKITDKAHYEALKYLIFEKKFITLQRLVDLGFTCIKLLNLMTNHHVLVKRKFLGLGKQIIIYEKSQGEDVLQNYINNEYHELTNGEKSQYVRDAYKFQNETVPKLIKLWFGKNVDYNTEVYKKGADFMTYKFDIIIYKKIKFLSKFRKIPVIVEVKNFFLKNTRFGNVIYFKHKLDQCYPTGYLAILLCKGAGPKEIYDRAGAMNIWIRDINADLKKIISREKVCSKEPICEPGIPAYSH